MVWLNDYIPRELLKQDIKKIASFAPKLFNEVPKADFIWVTGYYNFKDVRGVEAIKFQLYRSSSIGVDWSSIVPVQLDNLGSGVVEVHSNFQKAWDEVKVTK